MGAISKDSVVCLPGWVLVKPLVSGGDGVVKIGSQEIVISGDYQAHRVGNVIGEVIACCERANVSRSMMDVGSVELCVGDHVWYSYTSLRDVLDGDKGLTVEVDGVGKCMWVEYERCFCYVRDWDGFGSASNMERMAFVRGLNGYCLGIGVKFEDNGLKRLGLIDTGDDVSTFQVKVVATGEGIDRYTVPEYTRQGGFIDSEFYPRDKNIDIHVGDIVLLDGGCNIPIEGDYSRLLSIDGVIPFRFQRRHVSCVVNDPDVIVEAVNGREVEDGITMDEVVEKEYWDKMKSEREKIERGGKKSFRYN